MNITYALPVLLGLLVLFVFPMTKHMQQAADRQKYYAIQGITLLGALLGAKLVALTGDLGWPLHPVPGGLRGALASGRSVVGGLLFGLLFAEIAKPLFRYRLPPNDRFATVLPFSIAIGRLGCVLTGCCAGLPHRGVLSVADASGVHRYPSQLMELLFQLSIGVVFIAMVRRGMLYGRLFSLYLVVYAVFRFATEFYRDTPKWIGPLSIYQLWCIPMFLVGLGLTLFRRVERTRSTVTLNAANA